MRYFTWKLRVCLKYFVNDCNLIIQNSLLVFTFSVFDRKYTFYANLVPNLTILCLKWNFVPKLIRLCRIQRWYSLLFTFDRKYPFLFFFAGGEGGGRGGIKIVFWFWNLEPRLIRICRIRWLFSFFTFLDWKYFSWVKLDQKFKIVSLNWNLVPALLLKCKIRK